MLHLNETTEALAIMVILISSGGDPIADAIVVRSNVLPMKQCMTRARRYNLGARIIMKRRATVKHDPISAYCRVFPPQ